MEIKILAVTNEPEKAGATPNGSIFGNRLEKIALILAKFAKHAGLLPIFRIIRKCPECD